MSQLAMNCAFVHMSAVLGTKVFQVQSALRIVLVTNSGGTASMQQNECF